MASALEERIKRLEAALARREDLLRQLQGQIAGLKQQQFQQGGGPSAGGDGGGGGVYYCDHVPILAGGMATGITVIRSWGGTDSTNGTVHNTGPDQTSNTKRQLLGKNPDGSYTVTNESCLNS